MVSFGKTYVVGDTLVVENGCGKRAQVIAIASHALFIASITFTLRPHDEVLKESSIATSSTIQLVDGRDVPA